jgi:glycosyltransferase involved in cell wall biosynthesis
MKKHSSKKRLLILDPADILGGAELFMLDLLENIRDKFDIHVVTGANEDYQKKLKELGVSIHICKLPRLKPISPVTILKLVGARRKIAKLIDTINPDVVISNTVRGHIVSSQAAKRKNKKLLWLIHDDTFPSWLLRRLIHLPDLALTCSQYIKKIIIETAGDMYENKVSPIYNGVDLKKIERSKKEDLKIRVGCVGRIVPWKGQEYFIRAAKLMIKNNIDWNFRIIGKTHDTQESKQYLKKLEEMITDTPNIEIIKDCEDALGEIAKLDALIHTSITPEPFGRVIIEAMALKTPVIASNKGGPMEIVDDGVDGFIVEPKDTEMLANKIRRIVTDKKLRDLFVENAYTKIEENYTLEKIGKKFLSSINKL